MKKSERRRRIWQFWKLFAGMLWDFRKEGRLIKRVGPAEARRKMEPIHRRRAIQFRDAALSMGGVLVKLGQFLGVRADIMPDAYIEELSKLQDQVPPVSYDEVVGVVESEFGKPIGEVFPRFSETPVAAASLAQVHEAELPDGTPVVVKVQRPGIDELADLDLGTFAYIVDGIAALTEWGKRHDLPALAAEFARVFGDELDFYREAHYAERFAANFAGDPHVYIPKVYWDYVTQKVVTLERVNGVKPNDLAAMRERGIDPKEAADIIVNAYLKQILEDGFFHADPHPGNLFVSPGPVITFVDFGMVDDIGKDARFLFSDLIVAIGRRDIDDLVTILSKLGFVRPGVDTSPVKDAIDWLLSNYESLAAKEIDFESLDRLQADIRRIIYEQPLTVPSEFGFLGRAVAVAVGLVVQMVPDYDFVAAVKPYIDRMIMTPDIRLKYLEDEIVSTVKAVVRLPKRALEVLDRLEEGEIEVRARYDRVVEAIDRSRRINSLTGLSVLIGALSIAASILLSARIFALAFVFFGAAGILAVAVVSMAFAFLRERPPKNGGKPNGRW